MKSKPKEKFWLYWWWCEYPRSGTGPFLKSTYSSSHWSTNRMQAYDRENGCKVGKMHKMQIEMEAPPK